MKQIIFLLTISFVLPMLCLAQDNQLKKLDSTPQLKEVIITATRKKTDYLLLPYSVNLVTKKDLDHYQYRTTPEALTGAAGVFVQKTNHGGGSPFVRGLTGNQTLMLLDGIRLNNLTFRYGPNQYLNTIDVYTISTIEVVRGTGSVQYGSDALGGVIQVLTKDPTFNLKKSFHATAMGKSVTDDMEYTGRGEVAYQSDKFAILAGITNRKFGDLIGGDTTGKQSPSGYKEQSIDVKLKWKVGSNSILTVSHQLLQQRDVPLYHRVKLENFAYNYFAPQQRQMSYANLSIDGNSKWLQNVTIIASLQKRLEKRSYQKKANVNRFIEEDKVKTLGFTMDALSEIANNWTANSGIEFYHDIVKSSKQQINTSNNNNLSLRGLYPNNASGGNFSLYSLHHVTLNRFTIETGLRYNGFSIKIPDTVTTSLKLGDVTLRPASLVFNAALLYNINQFQSVYASFNTGYRSPNIDDMGTLGLVDFRYEIPAYDLKPEKTYNSEFGFRFGNNKIQTSVAVFYMSLTNLITRVQVPNEQVGGYNVYTKENSQQSFLTGAETNFDCVLSNRFSLKAVASYTYGQNTSRNEPLRRTPPFNGRLVLDYHLNKWQAGLEYLLAAKQDRLAQGDKDDNRIPLGGTPGWNIVNCYAGYVIDKISIHAGFQNLFNQDYRTHGSGINGMGRSANLSFQIKF